MLIRIKETAVGVDNVYPRGVVFTTEHNQVTRDIRWIDMGVATDFVRHGIASIMPDPEPVKTIKRRPVNHMADCMKRLMS